MKSRSPVVIVDEDFRSENAGGFGIRALERTVEYFRTPRDVLATCLESDELREMSDEHHRSKCRGRQDATVPRL